jgi:uncharacterized 2Fe-2S/4Fe-4S cluster protein (DUF4445 family)
MELREKKTSPSQDLPLAITVAVQADPPDLQDNTADLDRLRQALERELAGDGRDRSVVIPFAAMAPVGQAFRAAGFHGQAIVNVLADRFECVDFLGEASDTLAAMALDLGTTHLEATLIDLSTGDQLARANTPNGQIEYGADILSRIHFATSRDQEEDGLSTLQNAVVNSINQLAGELAGQAGLAVEQIRAISVSGNTTMVHFLLGLSPYHICREPYTPLVGWPDPFVASEIGLNIHCRAPVWVLPSIGSYFGGDLISGILASGLDEQEDISMLIDVGTNAEVVLGNREWLIACAGAAGPALEGGVARMGMRAGPGAIEHVRLDRKKWQLEVETIGGKPAVGICGSGLIELVAELFLAGIVDIRGKLRQDSGSGSEARHQFVRSRLVKEVDGLSFIVVAAAESGHGMPVTLAQVDLDAMMRSKAAMYAILTTLVGQVGVEFTDLDTIYVAGAFGRHIDPRAAITLGMLPDLPLSTFQPVGNSSLSGAELVLLSERARRRALAIGQKITYIELNVNQEFMIRFSGSRFIPHTDPHLFPSVPIIKIDDSGEKG